MDLDMSEGGVWIHLSTDRPPVYVTHKPTALRLLTHEGGRIIPDPRLKAVEEDKPEKEDKPVQEAPVRHTHLAQEQKAKGR